MKQAARVLALIAAIAPLALTLCPMWIYPDQALPAKREPIRNFADLQPELVVAFVVFVLVGASVAFLVWQGSWVLTTLTANLLGLGVFVFLFLQRPPELMWDGKDPNGNWTGGSIVGTPWIGYYALATAGVAWLVVGVMAMITVSNSTRPTEPPKASGRAGGATK